MAQFRNIITFLPTNNCFQLVNKSQLSVTSLIFRPLKIRFVPDERSKRISSESHGYLKIPLICFIGPNHCGRQHVHNSMVIIPHHKTIFGTVGGRSECDHLAQIKPLQILNGCKPNQFGHAQSKGPYTTSKKPSGSLKCLLLVCQQYLQAHKNRKLYY